MCLVGEMEKWKDGKLVCLDEKKNERMKNIVGINLLLYPYYLKYYNCKDQFRLRSNTGMDPGPRSPNNEFVECRKKS